MLKIEWGVWGVVAPQNLEREVWVAADPSAGSSGVVVRSLVKTEQEARGGGNPTEN